MSAVLVEEAGGVLTVTINRPDQRNALSQEVVGGIAEAIETARRAAGRIRVFVLRGAGGTFCAGGDLKEFKAMFQDDRASGSQPERLAEAAQINRAGGELFAGLAALPCVVIAAVDGAAVGGGFGLAAAADITVATRSARFSMSETRLGLLPAQITPIVAARVGTHHTRRLSVTAARIGADEAFRIGLVDQIVDDGALGEAVQSQVGQVLACAPQANAAVKRFLAELPDIPEEAVRDHAAGLFAEAMRGEEARSGLRAFIEGTAPMWRAG
ncbi:putative enoyl-CoA hydratase [Gordonia hirsuta DSM 44140 = NBRC 16056]|uniref:Putative enoyl-CoA hydratase n=1 Tax=Gordonia hirsuta DSM 44140 = NBRC 16056 TaxID=1121927 RepID=L7LDY9_9ACTN|nr:enoyl-CoA hydratase-related protein [Gordonia hirsuta]GAC58282.1 putative enoyl-CoA hydratase [Gordonia hirsuta DSM 44140 = NBRC 16056]